MLHSLVQPPRTLEALGWSETFAQQLEPKEAQKSIGRVVEGFRKSYLIHLGDRIVSAVPRNAMYKRNGPYNRLPVVGDWVSLDLKGESQHARLWRVLDRTSALVRQAPGTKTAPQVLAANLDTIFIVTSLNQDFNLARLERYLALVLDSGATPVFILTKADLCDDPQSYVEQVRTIAPRAEILPVSVVSTYQMAQFEALVTPQATIALVGSSGVGKSTLVNHLYGEEIQSTSDIREVDGRGRHTTTTRQLRLLPQGGLVIDTPGMRELQLWQAHDGLRESFDDIEKWASQCKFRDCSHSHEHGCAVKQAVEDGLLDGQRLERWYKLHDELLEQEHRQRTTW